MKSHHSPIEFYKFSDLLEVTIIANFTFPHIRIILPINKPHKTVDLSCPPWLAVSAVQLLNLAGALPASFDQTEAERCVSRSLCLSSSRSKSHLECSLFCSPCLRPSFQYWRCVEKRLTHLILIRPVNNL